MATFDNEVHEMAHLTGRPFQCGSCGRHYSKQKNQQKCWASRTCKARIKAQEARDAARVLGLVPCVDPWVPGLVRSAGWNVELVRDRMSHWLVTNWKVGRSYGPRIAVEFARIQIEGKEILRPTFTAPRARLSWARRALLAEMAADPEMAQRVSEMRHEERVVLLFDAARSAPSTHQRKKASRSDTPAGEPSR